MIFETYSTPEGEVMIAPAGQAHFKLEPRHREFITGMIARIRESYPEAYKAMSEAYKASSDSLFYYEFLIVRRFLKCNFGNFDNVLDFDSCTFKFEFVSCPMRGECKYDQVICNPKFNSSLSERELQVMKLFHAGLNESQIADKLYISINTVLNHKKASFRKTGSHTLADFMTFSNKYNLFAHGN
ncbi:MAG: helix-turn-helix transcriptional regulator [Bacteroidales bacterium]|nr:helix-turn-helix transcriptional regulator [Bacteroidales bacterium]